MSLPEPPWYRQGWPWFIIAFPATSVVLGIMLLVLAIRTDDALVVDDYYKEGKTINRRIERDQMATGLGVAASIRMLPAGLSVELSATDVDFRLPAALELEWVHVTDAERDGHATLDHVGGGRYVAAGSVLPVDGRWRLHLSPVTGDDSVAIPGQAVAPDGADGWRLVSDALWLLDGREQVLSANARREVSE